MSLNIKLKDQECEGNYQFNSQIVMTRTFESQFGDKAMFVVLQTMALIHERVEQDIADYLQVCELDGKKFWVIDDVDHITFLLPSDY